MHFIIPRQKKLCEVGTILTSDTCNQSSFQCFPSIAGLMMGAVEMGLSIG